MWRIQTSSSSLQLRNLLHRFISSPTLPPPPSFVSQLHRFFSSSSRLHSDELEILLHEPDDLARSISTELLSSDPLSLTQRLDLSFSHVTPSPSLIQSTLTLSPDAGRSSLEFLKWVSSRPGFVLDDETLASFVAYLGRRIDFKAIHEILTDARDIVGMKCFETLVNSLVVAKKPSHVVDLFERMERDYGFVRDKNSHRLVVSKLCDHGFGSHAERMVKDLSSEFFPDDKVCDMLIKGWCVGKKLDEARRLAGEMYRGGFEIGTVGYNAILDCVCKLCRLKEPFKLRAYAQKVLTDMDSAGVRRDTETFNVLIHNLCKVRLTEDAMQLFYQMGEWDCSPNAKTFIFLIKSLYRAARIGEGDEMIGKMKDAGFGDSLDKTTYYKFIKALTGIERIDHALKVFSMMKRDGRMPLLGDYELLMSKLVAHGRVDAANFLYDEAVRRGVPVTPKEYKLEPRLIERAKPHHLRPSTVPQKKKRSWRKRFRFKLSFVRKPGKYKRRLW